MKNINTHLRLSWENSKLNWRGFSSGFSNLTRTTKGLIASCILWSSVASADVNDENLWDYWESPNQIQLFSENKINKDFISIIPHELLYISTEIYKWKEEYIANYSNSEEVINFKMWKIEIEDTFQKLLISISEDRVDNDFPEKIMKFCPTFGNELIKKLPSDSEFLDSLLIVNMMNEYSLAYSKKNKN